jgi:hypothetical protein
MVDRFWSKVDITSDCWLWTASRLRGGYAAFWAGVYLESGYPRPSYGHVWIWEQENGPLPEGMQLDHRCRIRHCVRPSHLEVVTNQENSQRGADLRVVIDRLTSLIEQLELSSLDKVMLEQTLAVLQSKL